MDGVDQGTWSDTYGVKAEGNKLHIGFVTQGPYSKNIGSRNFLMQDENNYRTFSLLNKEFTFTVDVSMLPCGLNGALYFSEMQRDGGFNEFTGNKIGAEYGAGYCDAQCPHDVKFISGEGNSEGWKPSPEDPNAGAGQYGACCMEFDIWEANAVSQAYTAHPCSVDGHYRCMGTECGDVATDDRYKGVCDKDGCDLNPFRSGVTNFYGSGSNFEVDTSRPFTVVTQFITDDNTDQGSLSEVRRFYIQDGKKIETPKLTIGGQQYDSITDEMCAAQKQEFGEENQFQAKGGLKQMGEALRRGMVLVMSLWDDHLANMLWLDSDYPTDADPSTPGVARGTCSKDSGKPSDVENQHPDAYVVFSDIKSGELDTTYSVSQ